MNEERKRRDRRAILAGLAAIAAYAAFAGGRLIEARTHAISEAVAVERAALTRELHMIAGRAELPGRVEAAVTALDRTQGLLFDAADALAAEALLSDYVARAAAEDIVSLERIQSLTDGGSGRGLIAVTLSISAESDLQGILGFLSRLRTGEKLVRVPEISIEVARPAGVTGEEDDQQALRLQAILQGFAASSTDSDVVDSGAMP